VLFDVNKQCSVVLVSVVTNAAFSFFGFLAVFFDNLQIFRFGSLAFVTSPVFSYFIGNFQKRMQYFFFSPPAMWGGFWFGVFGIFWLRNFGMFSDLIFSLFWWQTKFSAQEHTTRDFGVSEIVHHMWGTMTSC
jgi:hypothetical protein